MSVGTVAQDMPDPSLIHGRAIPAPELAPGTVTVRVVREAIGNNVAGQQVRVTVNGESRTATTDELGRAEFAGLSRGAEARAEATVDGEALVSQPFAVPTSGGLRVILVAGLDKAAERRKQEEAKELAAPPTRGAVVLGPNSRIIMEFHEDALFVFYVLEIINSARTRVDTGEPIVIDLPGEAAGASVPEGSFPGATVNGPRLTIQGPFPPGVTPVQAQFRLQYGGSTYEFSQAFPIPLQRVTFGIQKKGGDVTVASGQFTAVNEIPTEDGNVYSVGTGEAVAAGTPLTVTISNLPAHSQVPRFVALGLALLIAGLGVWLAATGRRTADEHRALVARRDALLDDLAKLETQRRAGSVAADKYETRRKRIVSELERIYGELDEASSGPQGGGEGLAA